MIWSLFAVGILMMLGSAFLDNVRGPLFPEIGRVFSLSHSSVSILVVVGNFASVVGNFILLPLTQRFSEKSVAVGVLLFASFTVLCPGWISANYQLWIFGGCLGLSVAMLGSVSNLFVIRATSIEHRSQAMSAVHMMYGLGSLLGPLLVGTLLAGGASWHFPLLAVLIFTGASLALLAFLRKGESARLLAVPQSSRLSREQVWILITFASYVAGEVMVSMWMVTYLVKARGLTLPEASRYLTGFFLAMAMTRAICMVKLSNQNEKRILVGCLGLGLAGFLFGYRGWPLGFSLAGLVGPFFPLYLSRVSRAFPEQSRSLTLWILATMQLTLAIFHLVVGNLADRMGLSLAYLIPAVLLTTATALLFQYFRVENRALQGR